MNTTFRLFSLIAALSCASVATSTTFADVANTSVPGNNTVKSQEVVVHIQQDAPPAPAQTVVQKANEWVDFGKNVGSAMDASSLSKTVNATLAQARAALTPQSTEGKQP